MPHLDGTGPEGKGSKSGRALGKCVKRSNSDLLTQLGTGEGKRRQSDGGEGEKRRLKSGNKFLK